MSGIEAGTNPRDKLVDLVKRAEARITEAADAQALETVRVEFLGKAGELTGVLKQLGGLPDEERRQVGAAANEAKNRLLAAYEARRSDFQGQALDKTLAQGLDLTLPGSVRPRGTMHPVVRVVDDVCQFFHGMGYEVVEGPELETDYYNFEALNIPAHHPSRDCHDTFYLGGETGLGAGPVWMLRTHTSNVQTRVMESRQPPLKILAPGRVYRRDNDATHSPQFYQIEGFVVDKEVTFANLKATLTGLVRFLFGPTRQLRLRPSFFPFTEPSCEVDMSCGICEGKGGDCRSCRGGWLEIGGAGMIHPEVFRAVGYDPEAVTGFAFGMGADRIAMLRYNIPNIRLLYDNDVRFLRQF